MKLHLKSLNMCWLTFFIFQTLLQCHRCLSAISSLQQKIHFVLVQRRHYFFTIRPANLPKMLEAASHQNNFEVQTKQVFPKETTWSVTVQIRFLKGEIMFWSVWHILTECSISVVQQMWLKNESSHKDLLKQTASRVCASANSLALQVQNVRQNVCVICHCVCAWVFGKACDVRC